jgi:hypothetical protein
MGMDHAMGAGIMTNVVDLDGARIAPWLMRAIEGFIADPPSAMSDRIAGEFSTQFQRGYLACLIAAYREGLGRGETDARLEAAERILSETDPT